MDHYIIIGNGVAGVEAALTLRERCGPALARITIISKETDYFFSRTALMYAYMDMMERQDLEPYERQMWQKQHIELVRDEVVDLDAQAHQLTLKSGQQLTYTKLLLALGASPRLPPFKGLDHVKSGLVHFVSMQDLEACEQLTHSTQEAVVVGGGLIGIELVECLLHHKVKVSFLIREAHYWPAALNKEEGQMVAQHMRDHGVDVRLAEELDQIEVDQAGRVSAIVTNQQQRIPCQMLGICVGVVASTAWLTKAKSSPELGRGIKADLSFKTSLPDVYTAGDCAQLEPGDGAPPIIETIWYSAKRHGRLAALSMLGDHVRYKPPLFFNSSKFFEIEYTTVGQVVNLPPTASSHYQVLPGKNKSTRIVTDQDQRVIGFNMLGSRWNNRVLERWILERRDLRFVQQHLHEAQFDVEFGRLKLEQMTPMEATP